MSVHSALLPSVARMLVSRLPLVPNKEIAFGAVAATGVQFTLAHTVAWALCAGLRRMQSQPTKVSA